MGGKIQKLQCVFYEQRNLCFKFSLGLGVLDRGLEFEDSKESLVERNLQFCVQVFRKFYKLCACPGAHNHYKPNQEREPLCENSGVLQPGGVTCSGYKSLCCGDFLPIGLGKSGRLHMSRENGKAEVN